jgi:SulP family sulfate permease
MASSAPQRKETADLQLQIQAMKEDLDALKMGDDALHTREQSILPDRYEFNHRPAEDGDEFRLVPPANAPKSDAWKKYLPITYWLPRYKWKEWFPMDLVASITDIVMVIPQSMGYALVAGLPPINGLYSALMGHCLYSPFGTSGQLIVAPVAVVSLMTKETLEHFFADDDHDDPVIQSKMAAYGSALAFQSGVICILLGLMKAGILANMLAEPVIVGFTFAAAILIGISQLTFVFQVDVHGHNVIEKLITFFSHLGDAHAMSIVLAVCCMIFLLIIKYWMKGVLPIPGKQYAKFIPSALILVVISTAISASGGESTGFAVVGTLPAGLPQPFNFFTLLDDGDFWHLCMPAFLITILSFIESIAVAQKFADSHGYSIDASQELLALGICNLVGCWFQIYPVSGVLSLATVVEAAGATTPLYGIMAGSGLIVCCALLLFLFEWLPKPVLGAIVFVGIMGLIDTHKMKKIYKLNKRDFIVTAVTILVTLFLGIDFGVALGVVASIVLFIQKSAKPHYSILGKMNISGDKAPIYRNIKMYPSATRRDDMLMIRWDAPIFFANTASFKSRIRKHIGRFLEENNYPNQWCLVLCFSGVNDVDFTGIEHLEQFLEELKEKEHGMTLVLTKVKVQVLNQLTIGEICGDGHIIPKENILWEIHEAEEWWDQKIGASKGGDKNGSKMDKYKANGALSDDETELLSDDGNDAGGVHGFTATHIANNMVGDDGELMKQ